MKVLAAADLHGNLPEIEECDILLIAGDGIADVPGSFPEADAQAQWIEKEFISWLESLPAKYIVAVAGNHDFVFEKYDLACQLPWIYLKDEKVEIEGITIYGSPWVINLPAWAFHKTEDELNDIYSSIPEDLDILLTHGPPWGKGDIVSGICVGSTSLKEAVEIKRPKYHVFGHIHEGFGHYRSHIDTEFLNVAYVDEYYSVRGQIVEVEL